MKSHIKTFLFTTLDMKQSKIRNTQKLIVRIPCKLFSAKLMDTLKILIKISIRR